MYTYIHTPGTLCLECGSGFTNKLEGMFKDMDLSRDIAIAFSQVPSPNHLSSPSRCICISGTRDTITVCGAEETAHVNGAATPGHAPRPAQHCAKAACRHS